MGFIIASALTPLLSPFSRSSPAPAVTATSVTNTQASEVTVPQTNSSESSGGKESGKSVFVLTLRGFIKVKERV